jgi:Ca2+-binding EF-hand superfamily protein
MANLYIEAKEKNNLKMIFHSLDDEKDGELEIKELVVQLKEKFDITVRLSEME